MGAQCKGAQRKGAQREVLSGGRRPGRQRHTGEGAAGRPHMLARPRAVSPAPDTRYDQYNDVPTSKIGFNEFYCHHFPVKSISTYRG